MTTESSPKRPTPTLIVAVATILLIVAYRWAPHPWNVAPVGALFALSGLYLGRAWKAWALPFAAMILSDVPGYLSYDGSWMHTGRLVDYLAFALVLLLARQGASHGLAIRIGAVLSAPVLFFVVSNFGVWLVGTDVAYPRNASGLATCYAQALPFFRGTLIGDWLFGLTGIAAIEGLPRFWLRATGGGSQTA